MMSNVFQFPKAASPPPEEVVQVQETVEVSAPQRETARGFLPLLWACVRVPLFLVLYWLRFPLALLCRFLAAPVMLIFLFTLWAFPDKTNMHIGLGVVSFIGFAGLWLYDWLLMALSPQEMMRTL